jgi:hypothetical protein
MPAFLNQALVSQPHIVYINESGLYCLVIRLILYMEDKKKMNELMPSRNGTPFNSNLIQLNNIII